jgi:subtilase family serine protease
MYMLGSFAHTQPCSQYWHEKQAPNGLYYAICGYTPSQITGAYGLTPLIRYGIDGRGTTIAIVDAFSSPYAASDLAKYDEAHGLPKANLTVVSKASYDSGWAIEEELDLEAAHTIAPGAKLIYIGANSAYTTDLQGAILNAISFHPNVISDSWGQAQDAENLPAADRNRFEAIFAQAIQQKIGVFFASGDSGDNASYYAHDPNPTNGPVREPGYPASSPQVTAVGGTVLAIGKKNNYKFETGWSTFDRTDNFYMYGSGGGSSVWWRQPSYQRGIVPCRLQYYRDILHHPMRVTPDISMVASPSTPFLIGVTINGKYQEGPVGGTSLASPMMAAVEALADQVGGRHGFLNPELYAMYQTRALRDVYWHPVTLIDTPLRVQEAWGTTLHVRRGFDDMTGLGSINGANFIFALASQGQALDVAPNRILPPQIL